MASAPISLAAPSFGEAGRGLLRLFQIEVRRSLGLLLFPVLVGISWLASHQLSYGMDTPGIALWPEASLNVSSASLLLAPIIAALLAWDAGREQRRRLGDLLVTTPRPPFSRDLTRWAGTVSWALLAYLIVIVVTLFPTAQAATWGGPNILAILVGVAFIPAAGAAGYLAGGLLPNRFVPPLVAIGFYVLEFVVGVQGPTSSLSELKYFSPFGVLADRNPLLNGVFYNPLLDIYREVALWLVLATAALLSMLAVHRNRNRGAVVAMAMALMVAGASATPLLATPADQGFKPGPPLAYEPTCAEGAVPICVHPAYERLLPTASRIVGTLVVPLTGFDGGIVRADQSPNGSDVTRDGVFRWQLLYGSDMEADMPGWISEALVHDFQSSSPDCWGRMNNAQYAVAIALEARGGWALGPGGGDDRWTCEMETVASDFGPQQLAPSAAGVQADVYAAAKRFAALSVKEQRAWFAEHYWALRAGELTLEDLP